MAFIQTHRVGPSWKWEDIIHFKGFVSRIYCKGFHFYKSLLSHSQEYLAVSSRSHAGDSEFNHYVQELEELQGRRALDNTDLFRLFDGMSTSYSVGLLPVGWRLDKAGSPSRERLIITSPNIPQGHLFITHDSLVLLSKFMGADTPDEVVSGVQAARNYSCKYTPKGIDVTLGCYLGNPIAHKGFDALAYNFAIMLDQMSLAINKGPYKGSMVNQWLYSLLVAIGCSLYDINEQLPAWFEHEQRLCYTKLTKAQKAECTEERTLAASIILSSRIGARRAEAFKRSA